MPLFADLISYFENSALADNIRENDLLFPLIESVHVVAICLVVGSILAVDLRLLGLASINRSVSRVTQGILPLTWGAFVVAVGSGGLLFISNATKYLGNGYPITTVACREKYRKALYMEGQSSTHGGQAVACAAALATVNIVIRDNLAEHARRTGAAVLADAWAAVAGPGRIEGGGQRPL